MTTENRKILAQNRVNSSILTDIYTVPSLTQTVVSTIIICNTNGSTDTFNLSISPNGVSDQISQYIYYGVQISGNDSFASTLGITLNEGDVIRFFSENGTSNITIFGVELN